VAAAFALSVLALAGCEDALAPAVASAGVGGLASDESCRVETITRRCDDTHSVTPARAADAATAAYLDGN
jgi:hypothetical protein